MRKLALILPVVLLASGCSMLFKHRSSTFDNSAFSNMSMDMNTMAPLPPMGGNAAGGNPDLTADQGGSAPSGGAAGGKPGGDQPPADDQGAPPPDQGGGDQGGDQGAPGK